MVFFFPFRKSSTYCVFAILGAVEHTNDFRKARSNGSKSIVCVVHACSETSTLLKFDAVLTRDATL